jgi:hypothetical protein
MLPEGVVVAVIGDPQGRGGVELLSHAHDWLICLIDPHRDLQLRADRTHLHMTSPLCRCHRLDLAAVVQVVVALSLQAKEWGVLVGVGSHLTSGQVTDLSE